MRTSLTHYSRKDQIMRTVLLILCVIWMGTIPNAAAGADLSQLAWLGGTWTGTIDGVEMEEYWLPPKGNTMLGVHRDVKNDRTVSFEFFRLEATSEGVIYWASPRSKTPVPFQMIESANQRVVFENKEHDYPQRIIYWLDKTQSLHARTEGTEKGQAVSEEWAWQRKK